MPLEYYDELGGRVRSACSTDLQPMSPSSRWLWCTCVYKRRWLWCTWGNKRRWLWCTCGSALGRLAAHVWGCHTETRPTYSELLYVIGPEDVDPPPVRIHDAPASSAPAAVRVAPVEQRCSTVDCNFDM